MSTRSDDSLDPGLLDSTEIEARLIMIIETYEFPFLLLRYCVVYLSFITERYD